jgi:hypothetical protein
MDFPVVLEAGIAGDNEQLGETGELSRDVFCNAVREVVVLRLAAELPNGRTAIDGRSDNGNEPLASEPRRTTPSRYWAGMLSR